MNKNQKGFSVVEVLIVVVIAGLVGAVGWLVWDRQKTIPVNTQVGQQEQKQEAPKQEEAKRTTLISSDGTYVTYSSLPEGWKVSAACEDGDTSTSRMILPPNKGSVRCNSEDWGFVAIRLAPSIDANTIKDCSGEENKRKEQKQYDYFVSYVCEEVVVNGNKGTKEAHVSNEKAAFTGGDTFTDYNFVLASGKVLKISFTNPTSSAKPEYTTTLDSFVKDLKF